MQNSRNFEENDAEPEMLKELCKHCLEVARHVPEIF